jgi:hypothetical protein
MVFGSIRVRVVLPSTGWDYTESPHHPPLRLPPASPVVSAKDSKAILFYFKDPPGGVKGAVQQSESSSPLGVWERATSTTTSPLAQAGSHGEQAEEL